MVGTLYAAAYSLLVSDFFGVTQDGAKVTAIAIWTFFVIYMKRDDHAYAFQVSYLKTNRCHPETFDFHF